MAERNAPLAPVPLFDRLVDEAPDSEQEPRPLRAFGREGLRASVARELSQLLNTRCPVPVEALAEQPRSVLNYGLPDLSYFTGEGRNDPRALARIVAETIAVFEPRLINVKVDLSALDSGSRGGVVQVAGDLRIGRTTEPVSFPVAVSPGALDDEAGREST